MKQNVVIKYMNDCPLVCTTIGTLEIKNGILYFDNAVFDNLHESLQKRICKYMRTDSNL